MKCPNTDCDIDFELTWSRYFNNPLGRFNCPECSAKFKYQRPFTYYLWIIAICLGFFILISIMQRLCGEISNFKLLYLMVTILYMAIMFSIDRSIESKYPTKLLWSWILTLNTCLLTPYEETPTYSITYCWVWVK